MFIPLRDATPFKRQLGIVIMDNYIEIAVPIDKIFTFIMTIVPQYMLILGAKT